VSKENMSPATVTETEKKKFNLRLKIGSLKVKQHKEAELQITQAMILPFFKSAQKPKVSLIYLFLLSAYYF